MKSVVLLDHDGVLVDTERWYFEAGRRALADVGVTLDLDDYLADMALGRGTWARAREAGVDEATIDRARVARDAYYQQFLRTEDIEIACVEATLAELARHARLAVVTTSKRADFELIHHDRHLLDHVELVLVREDYEHAKPHPEPYLTALQRLGVEPHEALVVEDSARGLASAVAAGLDCAVVHHPFTASQDLSRATHRIGSLGEVISLLRASRSGRGGAEQA
ncbi:HAD family phosphatase [Nocardioides marinquilinus]|uniref:HAD family phosphatase n=1 Tax=Nocardioides marinquilinus TaxID=1210400 RepID=A0ABP9PK57_9ACTN